MTKLLPVLFLTLCGLTGCAGWVVFGHTIGAKEQAASAPAVTPESASPNAGPSSAAQPVGAGASVGIASPAVASPAAIEPAATQQAGATMSGAPVASASVAAAPVAVGSVAATPLAAEPMSAAQPVAAVATSSPSNSKRPAESPPSTSSVKAVTLTLTSQAAQKAGGDPRFQQGALLDALEHTLRARKLLDEKDSTASGSLEVSIEDFGTRASTNAVVLGYNLGTGTLVGEVTIRDASGKTVRHFPIRAHSRLASLASDDSAAVNGEKAASGLAPLYHRFAKLTANGVAGTEEKPDYAADNKDIPR